MRSVYMMSGNVKAAKEISIKNLTQIPGVGRSLATDLWNIGITSVSELRSKDPEILYNLSNQYAGALQDRCVLYVFRCAVYYANTSPSKRDPEKLKWWWWKDSASQKSIVRSGK